MSSTVSAGAQGLLGRLGTALVSPRLAAQALCRGQRGGLADVLWLLPLRLLTGEAAIFLSDDARAMVLNTLSALSIDLVSIFLGGVLMALFLGRREQRLRPGLTTDLAALGWFAWLGIQSGAALLFVITQHSPGPTMQRAVQILGLLVFAAYWGIAFFVARRVADESPETPKSSDPAPMSAVFAPEPPRARAIGGIFLAALSALALYDLAWIYHRQPTRPSAGRAAPEVVLPTLIDPSGNATAFRLSAERGHPVLLDFFATWCKPCKASLPALEQVYKRLKPRGLRVVAIDGSEDEALVRNFVSSLSLHLPVGLDNGESADRYGVTSIPYLVLIGSDGSIKRIFHGVHSAEEIEQAVLSQGF